MPTKKTIIQFLVVAILLSVTLAAAACGGDTTTDSSAPTGEVKTLKIGCLQGLTGPLSVPALAFMRGFEIYADTVNEQGGVKIGNDTYKIELIQEDTKSTTEGTAAAATKLVEQDGVKFVIGGILAAEASATYQVTQPAGVLYMISGMDVLGGAPHDVAPDKDLLIRLTVDHDDDTELDLDYVVETYPDAKTMAIVTSDTAMDSSIERIKTAAAKRGIEVINTTLWPWPPADMMPYLQKVVPLNPDIIFFMYSIAAPDELKAARQLGWKGIAISDAPLGADVYISMLQDPAILTDLVVNSPDVFHPIESLQTLMDKWKEKWPNDGFISDCMHSYDMPWALIQAMQKAGSIEPAAVEAAFETMTNQGDIQTNFGAGYMTGMDRYGCDKVLARPFPITHIMNGETEWIGMFDPVRE